MHQTFPRSRRLLKSAEYQQVLRSGSRIRGQHLTLVARPSAAGVARLGLAISKRSLRRAVDRNRIKRLVRESFRVRYAKLPAVDVVVQCRSSAKGADNAGLAHELDALWVTAEERFAEYRHERRPAGCHR